MFEPSERKIEFGRRTTQRTQPGASDQHDSQQPTPRRGKVLDALVRRAGKLKKPQKRLQAALVGATESEWQPQVRGRAREQASTTSGMMVEVTAFFGFTCTGSSDDGRIRTITTPISPTYAKQILELQEAGATQEDLHPIVAEASTESYFTEWGTRADGLRTDFTHVQAIEFLF